MVEIKKAQIDEMQEQYLKLKIKRRAIILNLKNAEFGSRARQNLLKALSENQAQINGFEIAINALGLQKLIN